MQYSTRLQSSVTAKPSLMAVIKDLTDNCWLVYVCTHEMTD